MESLYIELVQWRGLERLFALLIGGMSIAAGWHLFLKGVVQDQEADIQLQNIKLSLKKAGPGVFFALFGAWLIVNVATTQASLEGISTSAKAENTGDPDKTSFQLAFLSQNQNSWPLKFLAASNTLAEAQGLLMQATGTLHESDPDQLRRIRVALAELNVARRFFLLEAFPPELKELCREKAEAAEGPLPDNCQLMREYTDAAID